MYIKIQRWRITDEDKNRNVDVVLSMDIGDTRIMPIRSIQGLECTQQTQDWPCKWQKGTDFARLKSRLRWVLS